MATVAGGGPAQRYNLTGPAPPGRTVCAPGAMAGHPTADQSPGEAPAGASPHQEVGHVPTDVAEWDGPRSVAAGAMAAPAPVAAAGRRGARGPRLPERVYRRRHRAEQPPRADVRPGRPDLRRRGRAG